MELSSLKFNKEIKTYEREITENLNHIDPRVRKEAALLIDKKRSFIKSKKEEILK